MEDTRTPQEDEGAEVASETPPPETNIKAEMNRKFENINQQLQAQNQALQAQLNQILESIPRQQPVSEQSAQDLKQLAFDDPDKYAQIIEERALKRANQAVQQTLTSQQRSQATIAQLASEYPEIKDDNSELAQKAIKIFQNLPETLRSTPEGSEMAIRRAAAELGVVPVNKRKQSSDNDDFSVGGSSGSKKPRSEKSEVDPKTLAFAELMGLNTKDPKVVKSLGERAKREVWNRYK